MGYDKVEFINTPFDELLPGLNQKKYDIAMNNFSKTKARSIDYAASDSYAKAAFSIVAKKGSNLKADIDSMNGRKVAIKKGSSSERVVKSFPGSIIVEQAAKKFSDELLSQILHNRNFEDSPEAASDGLN